MNNVTAIEKLNPAEYGLKETDATTIEKAFEPKIIERNALSEIYESLITGELTPALCAEAKVLRLKLMRVRTGIAEIHKTQKAFYLAAGRFVDAWKNKETAPVEQMEEVLEKIEKHYENLEKERKSALRTARIAELEKYEVDGSLIMLGEMTDDVWANYLAGVKLQYEQKKEAERKAEEERLAAIEAEKKRQEEIRLENERLKKEREALEIAQAAERKKLEAEKAKAEKARKEAEAKMLADAKIAREKLEAERKEKERIEAELRAKREAEAAEQREAAERVRKLAMAPDKDKLKELSARIKSTPLPAVTSKEASAIIENVKLLLSKIDIYINDSITKM